MDGNYLTASEFVTAAVSAASSEYVLPAPTTAASEINIDYGKSVLTFDRKLFAFPPLSPAAQELIVAGGAENLVASRLRANSM